MGVLFALVGFLSFRWATRSWGLGGFGRAEPCDVRWLLAVCASSQGGMVYTHGPLRMVLPPELRPPSGDQGQKKSREEEHEGSWSRSFPRAFFW